MCRLMICGKKIDKIVFSKKQFYVNFVISKRHFAITGARGAGKTTMILQHIKKTFGDAPKAALYVSLDNIYFSNNSLLDFAHDFDKMGHCAKSSIYAK